MKNAQTLKGFRDFIGQDYKQRTNIFRLFEEIFGKYGYEGIQTPALEYAHILLDKYGEDEKLVYKFVDHGGREVAMRYDLTVPTARVLAQHRAKIQLPWKRYQLQPVWRADNTQKGRFREFYQLDIDVFGSSSYLVEVEMLLIGSEVYSRLGFADYAARLNSRQILNAIVEYAGRKDDFSTIVTIIDKWDKRTKEETKADLLDKLSNNEEAVAKIMQCVELQGSNSEKISALKEILGNIIGAQESLAEIEKIISYSEKLGNNKVIFDPTIARGLSYYTGPVWEWEINEGNVGSVGSGGRYDNLVASIGGEDTPACGQSFGIERILEVMSDRGMLSSQIQSDLVLITFLDNEAEVVSLEVMKELQAIDKRAVVYTGTDKLPKRFKYAEDIGASWVVLIGSNEIQANTLTIKNLVSKEQVEIQRSELASYFVSN